MFRMNLSEILKTFYRRHGKKAVIAFLIYFITKWTLTILFGAQILTFIKGCLG